MRLRGSHRLRLLANLGIAGAAFGLVTGYLGAWLPLFDTASQFRLHIGHGLFLGAPLLLYLRFPKQAAIAFFLAAICFFGARSGIPSPSAFPMANQQEPQYRLIAFNILFDNPNRQAIADDLIERDADILFLTENADDWESQMAQLKEHYGYWSLCGEWRNFGGSYLFSKFPIIEGSEYCQNYAALMGADIDIDGTKVTIAGAHYRWPWPAGGPKQMLLSGEYLQSLGDNVLVTGDFNSVPWSHAISTILDAGRLELIGNIGATWMFTPFPDWFRRLFGLPIDNVMKKGAVDVISVQRLPSMGSDHLPLEIGFSVRQ